MITHFLTSSKYHCPIAHLTSAKTGHEPLLKRLYLDRLLFPQLMAASTALGDYAKFNTYRRIEKHSAGIVDKEKGYEDIMAHLLEAGDEETGTKYTRDELLGEGILMMMAGKLTPLTPVVDLS